MTLRRMLVVVAGLATAGCPALIHGTGQMYIYNGSEEAVEIMVEGRSPAEFHLRRFSGELLDQQIAGAYQIAASRKGAFGGILGTDLVKERLTIINLDGKGCFARADVNGMYKRNKNPVKLLESYAGQNVISIADEIVIFPGERMPESVRKNPFGTQRVAVVPCDLIGEDWSVEDYLTRLK